MCISKEDIHMDGKHMRGCWMSSGKCKFIFYSKIKSWVTSIEDVEKLETSHTACWKRKMLPLLWKVVWHFISVTISLSISVPRYVSKRKTCSHRNLYPNVYSKKVETTPMSISRWIY